MNCYFNINIIMNNSTTKPMSIFDVNYNRSNNTHHRDRIVFCGNCGNKGHIYRDCKEPVISLGIILFRYDFELSKLKYMLVRRKDSIGYVEFLRGKYASADIKYIEKLFEQMTLDELERLKSNDFEILWKNMWMEDTFKVKKRNFYNDFEQASSKFNSIKFGYTKDNIKYNLNKFIENAKSRWKETEWGIPKGRRNIRETNLDAAKREFREETGINDTEFTVFTNTEPFIEEYLGSDNVKYRHIYYLARYFGNNKLKIDTKNKFQVTEISKLGFYDIEECNTMIRPYYKNKKDILNSAEKYINENELYKMSVAYFKTSDYSPCIPSTEYSKSF